MENHSSIERERYNIHECFSLFQAAPLVEKEFFFFTIFHF